MAVDPEKDKREKMIAAVLIGVLLLFVFYNVHRAQKRNAMRQTQQVGAREASPLPISQPPEPTPSPNSSSGTSGTEAKEALTWKRDPFLLGIGKEGELPTLQLKVSGIIYDETRPEATYAIINEEVVRIGDSLHGIKVTDIQPDYVRLKKFNQEVLLYLYQEQEIGKGKEEE